MSLSEKQPKMPNCSSNISYMNDDFVKLLWENGPIVSQSQSNKPRRSTFHSVFAPCGSKDNPFPKIGHFRVVEPKSNNHPLSGSSPGIGINARDDNDIVPWMNYPIDDSIHNGFCYPEFLNDYSEVNTNADTVPVADQVRSSHNVEHGLASEMGRITPQLNAAISSHKSSEINIGIGSSCKGQEKGVMNFSHFSRPVALARANLQDVDRLKSNKITSNNPMESSAVESACGLKSAFGTQHRPKELILDEQSKVKGDICKKNCNQNTVNPYSRSSEKIQSSSFEASVALGMHEIDKGNESAVAASSMCSCSSAGTTSNDHNQHWGKRKHCEGEESEYLSEDHEDESMDLKKHAPIQGKSKKRSRATEVHNLSERRRRDRINEKMRALQELIPNCNKMDKASMLDEAIEYLKYLQMQVQIMSMGSGLYMSPMIMQHVQASTMAHFSPMGVRMGMGIGLGYGMGMYDMNGSPFIQVPPVPGPQVRCLSGYQRMPGSHGLQIFGIPGQGFPVPTHYRSPSATTSEDPLQQKKTLEKSQGSDAENLRIQSTQAEQECFKNSSKEKMSDQPSLYSHCFRHQLKCAASS